MTNINLDLERVKGEPPWCSVTINGITEVYEECNLFDGDRIDFYNLDRFIKRIKLNDQVNVIVSSELEKHWENCER